jgi:hypothetical protein
MNVNLSYCIYGFVACLCCYLLSSSFPPRSFSYTPIIPDNNSLLVETEINFLMLRHQPKYILMVRLHQFLQLMEHQLLIKRKMKAQKVIALSLPSLVPLPFIFYHLTFSNLILVPRTVISVNGIKQNPTGWDQGERVWGGGIVKYKREGEWQPWPIDLDNETDAFDPSTLMGGAIIPGLLNSVNAQNNIVSTASIGSTVSVNGVFTHPSLPAPQERKQTEYAYSAGMLPRLTSAHSLTLFQSFHV